MVIEEILIVKHNDVSFGLPTTYIGQILRVPDITPLILAPNQVRGLCAVGGDIATAIDFNMLLNCEPCSGKEPQNRVITMNPPLNALCLLVSEVSVSISVEASQVEYLNDKKEIVMAIVHHNDELIQVIDLELALMGIHKQSVTPRAISDKNTLLSTQTQKVNTAERYLVFKMGGEEYALAIDNMREVLNANNSLTHIAGSNEEIRGMMSLRDELIVVADLRTFYHYTAQTSDKNRIMIVERHGKTLGLIIDEIVDIHEFCQSDIDDKGDRENQIEGIIQYKDRLISLIGMDLIDVIMQRNEEFIVANETIQGDEQSEPIVEVVIFKLAEEEYAFAIEEVAEIIDMTPITPVVNAPDMVDGVINIRGQIVTIGSLHKRLGIEHIQHPEQKIIICRAGGSRIGFFVNSVSDVMGVKESSIRHDETNEEIFSGILHLNDGERLVMMFEKDISKLVEVSV